MQALIDTKAAKLIYAEPGRPNWLLIHASGISVTGLGDLHGLQSQSFKGPFDRLLVYDPFEGFTDLKILP